MTNSRFRLPSPIPYRAHQGLCEVPEETICEIRAQWKQAQAAREAMATAPVNIL